VLLFQDDLQIKFFSNLEVIYNRDNINTFLTAVSCPAFSRRSMMLLNQYDETWDVALVLRHLETLYPHNEITLKNLSLKLVI
jgi:hypothetical protein